MLTGHYAAAYLLKKKDRRASLGIYFIAVQFVDILWALFTLMGFEKINIVPGFTKSNDLDLVFVPYTHSLNATVGWSILAFIIAKYVYKSKRTALCLSLAVFSHFILDMIVHTPDLPLGFGTTEKVGLGLWNYPLLAMLLELTILSAAFLYYRNRASTSCPLFLTLIVATILQYMIPTPSSVVVLTLLMLVVFGFFAYLGFKDKGTLKFSRRRHSVRA